MWQDIPTGEVFVAREREGAVVRYRIADDGVFALCDEVCGGVQRQLSQLQAIMEEGVTR